VNRLSNTTLGTLMATINGSTPASCNASDVACWQYGRVQLRCVIVDDDQVFLVAARALLERDGVVVAGVAHSRVEAIQQAEALRPDVVLIDIRLGQESGFEVARQLADNGQMAALIMISTHAGADYADLIAESPAKGFVAKTDLSAAAIRRVLGAD
jgi:DNA-binding NarL/FixJ family response regulator